MADKTKTSKSLKLVAAFTDGDDRTLTIDNPVAGIKKSDITATAFKNAAAAVLIGDKTGADFKDWKSAKVYESSVTYFDIKPQG